MTWRLTIACVLSAAAALAEAGPADTTAPGRVLNPQRLTRTVPVVDGHDLQFRRLTAEGLSRTRVAQIVQDDQGFMWFGTQRGLHRYDGHDLRLFRRDASRQSLSGVYVHSLLRDRADTLWVGSDGSLDRFDSHSETFTQLFVTPDGEQAGPKNVTSMHDDASGMLWLGTRSGLYRVDPRTQQTTVIRHRPGDPGSLASDAIQYVGEDRSGALWVGTAAGLDRVDRTSLQVVNHLPLSESMRGMAFHEDRAGVFWIIHGVDGQLAVLDRTANELSTWTPSSGAADASPVMFSAMLEDRDGTMWFGTLNQGVLRFDRDQRRFIRYTTDRIGSAQPVGPAGEHSVSRPRGSDLGGPPPVRAQLLPAASPGISRHPGRWPAIGVGLGHSAGPFGTRVAGSRPRREHARSEGLGVP